MKYKHTVITLQELHASDGLIPAIGDRENVHYKRGMICEIVKVTPTGCEFMSMLDHVFFTIGEFNDDRYWNFIPTSRLTKKELFKYKLSGKLPERFYD